MWPQRHFAGRFRGERWLEEAPIRGRPACGLNEAPSSAKRLYLIAAQQMAKMLLPEHNDVIEALSPD
jgi:hypothetical protein